MLKTTGRVLHNAAFYDLTVWLFTGGKERVFRETVVGLANLQAGESVLDIGCGTGSQAIVAKRSVGSSGSVTGLDASDEMLRRARVKSRKAQTDISFVQGVAEQLPFADRSFDVIFSTVMLHHLPRKTRKACLQEICRVVKPNGRVAIVDFEGTADQSKGVLATVSRHKHGFVASDQLAQDLEEAGLTVLRRGHVGIADLYFTIAASAGQ